MVSHTKVIRDYDMYGETAERFLQLIPTCCRSSRSNSLLENEGHQTETFDDGGNVATGSKSKFSFISPTENGIEYGTDPSLTSDSSGSDYYGFDANEADITDYLHSANWAVHRSYASCQGWSLPYDGDVPDPLGFRDDETLSPTSSNDSNSGLSSNNSVPLPSVGPPKTPPGPTMPGFFSRQANVRKSVRTNSYFGVRHSSALYIGSVPEGFSHVDLSLGPGEWAVDLEKFEEDEMFGEEEKRMTEPEEESSQLVADQIKTKSELNSAASSAQSSPAKQANRMGASMPTDYFKVNNAKVRICR